MIKWSSITQETMRHAIEQLKSVHGNAFLCVSLSRHERLLTIDARDGGFQIRIHGDDLMVVDEHLRKNVVESFGFKIRDRMQKVQNPFTGELIEAFPDRRTATLNIDDAVELTVRVVIELFGVRNSSRLIIADQVDGEPDLWPEEYDFDAS